MAMAIRRRPSSVFRQRRERGIFAINAVLRDACPLINERRLKRDGRVLRFVVESRTSTDA
jgi:hypothetical protein